MRTTSMIRQLVLLCALCIPALQAWAQKPDSLKTLTAIRTPESPKIDGVLEPLWNAAPVATDFTILEPHNGKPATHRTEVRVLYDDQGFYVGAHLYDPAPDSIMREIGRRDLGEGVNADVFGVFTDTYDDDQNGYFYMVSAAGVQTDARTTSAGDDGLWDAVWRSEVNITADGWVCEIMIPWSATRIPKKDVQQWGLQFMRVVRRSREKSSWTFIDKTQFGWINQSGILNGIEGIEPPPRLSFTPYVSGLVAYDSPGNSGGTGNWTRSLSGGMDLKYGLNDAFTLDMTLIPDFGQVQSDNRVLNISPFEVQYQERRPFFTEGTDLFQKNDLFYSRRIGAEPEGYYAAWDSLHAGDELVENPDKTQMLNAFKLSGRTQGKTGLGIFNAITGPARAVIRDSVGVRREVLTQPLTNYNIVVLDQALRGNSSFNVINTNRFHASGGEMANVSAASLYLTDKNNMWFVSGGGKLSAIFDAENRHPDLGHAYTVSAGKASGNFTFNWTQQVESSSFDISAMGFNLRNNEFTDKVQVQYNRFEPKWFTQQFGTSHSIRVNRLFQPHVFTDMAVNHELYMQLKNFAWTGCWLWYMPLEVHDYFEPRVPGRVMLKPPIRGAGVFYSSNYAKRFSFDFNFDISQAPQWNLLSITPNISPRYRVSNKLSFFHTITYAWNLHDRGWVDFDPDGEIIIGDRLRKDVENIFTTSYTFNRYINLNFRARHYWSRVAYQRYYELQQDGTLGSTAYQDPNDINFNVFNVDAVLTWRFAPGSDLLLTYKNFIYQWGDEIDISWYRNAQEMFRSPQTNSLAIKVLYFVDYMQVKQLLRKHR